MLCRGGAIPGAQFVSGYADNTFYTDLPGVSAPDWPTFTELGSVTISRVLVGSEDPSSPTRYRATSVSLSSIKTLTLSSPTPGVPAYVELWCVGDFALSGQARITVEPGVHVTFWVGGNVFLAGNGIGNPNGPKGVVFYGIAPPVGTTRLFKITTAFSFIGLIYAPEFDVDCVGGGSSTSFYGAIVGRRVTLRSFGGFHYDEVLADLESPVVGAPGIAVAQGGALTDGVSNVGYGPVLIGAGALRTFTITNPGYLTLTNLAVSVDGANAGDFVVSGPIRTAISLVESTTFTVTFTPSASGPRSAALHVSSNVIGSKNPFDIALTGTGNTAPVLSLPGSPVVAEATSASGATVAFSTTASDAEDGALMPTPDHASGSPFALGDTTVNVSVTDSGGGTVSGSFVVRVRDTTPPAITVLGANPVTVAVDASYSDAGATALDSVSGSVVAAPSGAVNTAVPGTYTITYTASDAAGNSATATRTVTVPHTPRADWRVAIFGAQAGNPEIAGDFVDPNGNGLVNLLEYALGGDPLGNGANVAPTVGHDLGEHTTLNFTRSVSRTDLTLTVQGADAVGGPWTDLARSAAGATFAVLEASAAVSESGSGDARAVTVSDAFALGDPAHPRRFLRLEVVR